MIRKIIIYFRETASKGITETEIVFHKMANEGVRTRIFEQNASKLINDSTQSFSSLG